ncbi:MAG: DUF2461 domain-containing protein [Bacteroidales bacterium]|jgi:uncharacterized protein (TIGR02453 family)|nr:DUF2461 domain-containing protein [Bacteroidales bacterium]
MKSINKSTLKFLSDLKSNNYRDWFQQNRMSYEEALSDFKSFIKVLLEDIITFDPILEGLEAKNCVYRIYRDIRFSPDKTPYKSHMGAVIVRGGRNNAGRYAGYYVHIEPGDKSIIGGGAYMPPSPWLSALREKIAGEGEGLVEIINNREFAGVFGTIGGEKLKSAPRGYLKDNPYIELLKHKSFLASRTVTDREVTSGDFFNITMQAFKAIKPFNDFLNEY